MVLGLLWMIAGGQPVDSCAWPDTVLIVNGCTGTLIHPQVVTFAAHCGGGTRRIQFGEGTGTGRVVSSRFCRTNPDYVGTNTQGADWAFCVLEEPITELPNTPPLYGCELDILQPGLEVVIAGFGRESVRGGSGTKRWATTTVSNTFGNSIAIGGDGVSTCSGDSGGSAFVQLDDGSWRALSMVSTGLADSCGTGGIHALMHPAVPWIEAESGIDVTPCHDVDGTWNPNPNCTGFFAGGDVGAGAWDDWCVGTPRSGPSATCGPSYEDLPDSDPPVVSIIAPTDRQRLEPATPVSVVVDAVDAGYGVAEVRLAIDGEVVGWDGYPPFAFDDVVFPNGVFQLVAVAEDWGGLTRPSAPVWVGVGEDVPENPVLESEDEGSSNEGCRVTGHAPASWAWVVVLLLAGRRQSSPWRIRRASEGFCQFWRMHRDKGWS